MSRVEKICGTCRYVGKSPAEMPCARCLPVEGSAPHWAAMSSDANETREAQPGDERASTSVDWATVTDLGPFATDSGLYED